MAYDPNVRASDADRDRAAALLREHHAAGRLTPEEFSDRLDSAFAAKTVGDIDSLLRDLPGIDLYRLPDAQLTRQARQSRPRRHRDAWRAEWGSWLSCVLLFFVIWALTGRGYLWPLWIVGPWGAILLGRWVTGSHPHGGQKRVQGSTGQDPGQLPRGDEDLPGRPGG
jgi:Domain of unknown function (DUF1707)